MIRVVLVDDHGVMLAGLSQFLSSVEDVEVVGLASDGSQALDLVAEKRPDVVLMDVSMPGVGGIEATRRIVAAMPSARVVALTSFADRERVVAMIDAGATGYLLKDGEPEELLKGIRAAARGEAPLAPTVASVLLRARSERSLPGDLTSREREVLELLATGLSNRRIATRLAISEATVKAHLTRIYQALGVTDRTSAALRAHELGMAPRTV